MADRYLPGLRGVRGDRPRPSGVLASANYLADIMAEVPMLVVPCIKGRLEHTAPALAAGFYGSIFPAVWSFQLALRSRGPRHLPHHRCTWRTRPRRPSSSASPTTSPQVALLPVAYTTGSDFSARGSPTGRAHHVLEPLAAIDRNVLDSRLVDQVRPVLGVLGEPCRRPAACSPRSSC